jgi:hypothetical protein
LVSPRRYGKTSLALKALEHSQRPYTHIDLYKALSQEDISRFILNGIGQLLGQIESVPEKLIKTATEFFAGFHLKFVMEKYGLAIEFGRSRQNAIEIIPTALEKLELYAAKRNKKPILFLDEFQVVHEITQDIAIEAAIREAAQKAKQISYVFSGSNRHLIEEMFNDKKRPFYKLCDAIILSRIAESEYRIYLNHAAEKEWHKPLSEAVLKCIFQLTERHSYYVNKLCSLLWQESYPTEKMVEDIWQQYVLENQSSIERELLLLSLNQRKLMIFIANEGVIKEPYSQHYASAWNMSTTSIHRALKILIEKDYVFKDTEGNYGILDPLIKKVLQQK